MNIDAFLNDLAANSSRNYKIDKLRENADNELLREVVRLALDPFTNFYIRKIPKYTPNTNDLGNNLDWALDQLITMLSMRQVTGNDAIEHLQYVLENVTADNAKVVERIIQKDLRCGVNVSTANAVWGGLVVDYPVMLCSQYEDRLVNAIDYPAYVQLKMDGMRFNAIVREGKVEFRSRNGKELHLLGNLEAEFAQLAGDVDCVFDGELIVSQNGYIADRQTGNGILNKANKGTIKPEEAGMVNAIVWDLIPYMYFVDGQCPTPYISRFDRLCKMEMPEKIKVVQNHVVNSLDEAQALFETYLASGQEGIILKALDGAWENKRTKSQIKFKGELECDLEVIGYEEGTGKYVGRLGALLLASRQENGKRLTVSVGSGFNDDHRDSFWAIRDTLIGKVVAVKYNQRITNKQGEESLFLPIFVELREDKTVADSIGDIK
jgi:hypothetical protein